MSFRFQVSGFKFLAVLALCVQSTTAADYQARTLTKAHELFHAATNTTMYAEAARQYEYLVHEDGIKNGYLFYTLGNSWFMAGDLGRALLNYRRAERLIPNDADLLYNLKHALDQRIDLIPEKEPHPLAARLFGWHFNLSTHVRWWLFAGCWIILWSACLWFEKKEKKEARITSIVAGILSLLLLASLVVEHVKERVASPGVIIEPEVLARKGDGEIYGPAFLDPLHAGTEFYRIEDRNTWWHIRLADGQNCWIPARTADMISTD